MNELNDEAIGKVKYSSHLKSLLYLMYNVPNSFDLKYSVLHHMFARILINSRAIGKKFS